ncbi:ATP-binding protein [Micromonospora tarensis]|uniref:ATP-binding protein n=1 Tax=Micromonospora tarensis TaxID=2806100 RepID=UPI001EE4771F|nr:ATP-binding protein [Micromonospora tarensis]
MFGHVGRRTQNLVGRQIALIDRLEQQEADPGRLEHLYRLDHISSRLRRNAGSLVVLSGSAGADAHTAPVPLADVVRLALGEIEDYTRVEVQVPAGIRAAPAVVGDLILALAELMENATVFSPPHTRVLVAAEASGVGARITVVDHGIGMSEQRLAEENARFTRRERLDLAPTEVLGLFVVGRLARRHGWTVGLVATGGGGVTAQLEIPQTSLVLRPAERTGATVARAAVPEQQGGGTAVPLDPEHDARAGTAVAVAAPARFDSDLLARATRSLDAGPSWDAFGRSQPAQASNAESAGIESANAASANADSAAPEPAGKPAGTRIRQRVPGASLHTTAAPTRPADATGADPAAARALVEAFQAGVRRAELNVTVDRPSTPGGAGPAGAAGDGSSDTAPDRPRLSRRVPGANLTAVPACQPPSSHLGDPAEVRALIDEFEAGVARALREVSPDHRNEEGSSR